MLICYFLSAIFNGKKVGRTKKKAFCFVCDQFLSKFPLSDAKFFQGYSWKTEQNQNQRH